MSRNVFIGVDGGGGTTECLMVNQNGKILGRALSSGSNIFSSGEQDTAKALKDAISNAGLKKDDNVVSACFGLSGVIYGIENKEIAQVVKRILPETDNLLVVCDAVTMLTGSIGLGSGIFINAGTGAICAGRNNNDEIAISSGWGHLLGDEGSGYWIGAKGIINALRAYDGRSAKTILLERILKSLGTDSPEHASQIIYASSNPKVMISELCPIVLESAAQNDEIASSIIKKAGEELALAVWSVANKLSVADSEIDIAHVGNCLQKSDLLQESLRKALKVKMPYAKLISPKFSPVVGSVLMALMEGGINTDELDMDIFSSFIYKGE